jgi:glucose/arabinose dehydrogenase
MLRTVLGLAVAWLGCLGLTACGDYDRLPTDPPIIGVSFERIAPVTKDGEKSPHQELTGMLFMPADHGVLIWEKAGRVSHYRFEGDALVLQGDLLVTDVLSDNDCGMTSVVLDPEWEENHYLYATHCVKRNVSLLVRYEFDGEHYDIEDSRTLVMELGERGTRSAWHNMNGIGFFDDDEHSMWVLTGEKTIRTNAQDLTTNLGKVLRILPRRGEGSAGYDPHPDNPFAGDPMSSSGPDIYAWGLRNPWRGALDRKGRLFVAEVGNKFEEVNLVARAGQNFGWPVVDGACDARMTDCSELAEPLTRWPHSSDHRYVDEDDKKFPTLMRAAWLGELYRSNDEDPYEGLLDGSLIFADMCIGFVRALSVDDDGDVVRDEHIGNLRGLTGAAQGPDGYLYVTSFGSCESHKLSGLAAGIYRVVPRTALSADAFTPQKPDGPLVDKPLAPFPTSLSDTGIFADDALREPIERAIRFEPTLPLWSNGSHKERWLLLPKGKKVDNSARDAWDYPVGTLFFKTFSYEGATPERIETRVIRRTETGYDYQVYSWLEDGSDAKLEPLANKVPVDVTLADGEKIKHTIPSGFDCRTCHESNDTVIIGFDELRLNGPRSGESGSQLRELAGAGVFAESMPSEPDTVAHDDEQTREVLGYLHGNCAHCHNRSDRTMSVLSLEHDDAFDNIVAVPTQGSGQAHGIRVDPGSPETSVLFLAMSGEGDDPELKAMPPVGVDVRDADAVELVRDWIEALPEP